MADDIITRIEAIPKLSTTDKLLLVHIGTEAILNDTDSVTKPTPMISSETGISQRRVVTGMQTLQKLGLIRIERRHNQYGVCISNRYHLSPEICGNID
jgi:biotin operon repressor